MFEFLMFTILGLGILVLTYFMYTTRQYMKALDKHHKNLKQRETCISCGAYEESGRLECLGCVLYEAVKNKKVLEKEDTK